MRTKTLLKSSASVLMAGSLASCGGGGDGNTPTPTATMPAPTSSSFQSKVSAAFASIFDASATGDPVNPTDASVPALAPTSDPISDS